MTGYRAPVAEQIFAIGAATRLARGDEFELEAEVAEAVLHGFARVAEGELAPLNLVGDSAGARFDAGAVTLPAGFEEAYRRFHAGGWGSLSAESAWGGQDLPFVLASAVFEQTASANMAFSLCPMLTQGAIIALDTFASAQLKIGWLPKLVSGEWTATMNLTEPQAGSDLGAVATRAERQGDGTYRLKGTKIFITWGEHPLSENILHLVLARVAGAPPGSRGLSLFAVPKYLPGGERNDVACISIERKLGIHASPTCTMSFGEKGGCEAFLVGEENGGLRAMFAMMNHARVNVGLQGVAIAERAYQGALGYARTRIQSSRAGESGRPRPIIDHPDVRRMLLTMRAKTEAARAIAYYTAALMDEAHRDTGSAAASSAGARADLLTPVTKAWCSQTGVEVADLAIQVHGGAGYIEETGAAQHLRDARIAPIYEGTNGIQALDLVNRKLVRDDGATMQLLIADMTAITDRARMIPGLETAGHAVSAALERLEQLSCWLKVRPPLGLAAGASPFLQVVGTIVGAALLLDQAIRADDAGREATDDRYFRVKQAAARFFVDQVLPNHLASIHAAMSSQAELSEAASELDWR